MSTRCLIGFKKPDGKCYYSYCHHDGYLNYVGQILLDNYNSSEKAEQFASGKGMSSIAYRYDKCNFYKEDASKLIYNNSREVIKEDSTDYWAEYIYTFYDGNWHVTFKLYNEDSDTFELVVDAVLDQTMIDLEAGNSSKTFVNYFRELGYIK